MARAIGIQERVLQIEDRASLLAMIEPYELHEVLLESFGRLHSLVTSVEPDSIESVVKRWGSAMGREDIQWIPFQFAEEVGPQGIRQMGFSSRDSSDLGPTEGPWYLDLVLTRLKQASQDLDLPGAVLVTGGLQRERYRTRWEADEPGEGYWLEEETSTSGVFEVRGGSRIRAAYQVMGLAHLRRPGEWGVKREPSYLASGFQDGDLYSASVVDRLGNLYASIHRFPPCVEEAARGGEGGTVFWSRGQFGERVRSTTCRTRCDQQGRLVWAHVSFHAHLDLGLPAASVDLDWMEGALVAARVLDDQGVVLLTLEALPGRAAGEYRVSQSHLTDDLCLRVVPQVGHLGRVEARSLELFDLGGSRNQAVVGEPVASVWREFDWVLEEAGAPR